MHILGLVTEYNPFHNGHQYHLKMSMKKTHSTHCMVVMSGHFLQRGIPSITHKWLRAQMAIDQGADVVIELPAVYACNSAEFFAYGSVCLLDRLNMVDDLCFGSELGDTHKLLSIANVLVTEPKSYQSQLKAFLNEGLSFPKARQLSLDNYFKDDSIKSILNQPNNILGIEYIKALIRLNSSITPHTLKRMGADYHSTSLKNNICSATAIRNFLAQNTQLESISSTLPHSSFKLLKESISKKESPVFYHNFENIILYKLRSSSCDELKNIFGVTEGLENRIKQAAKKAHTLPELLDLLQTKRYTLTRMKRILIHSLLNLNKQHMDLFLKTGPLYARILGFSKNGSKLLKALKKTSSIPILTNINKQSLDATAQKMLDYDLLATDIYSLGTPSNIFHKGGQDFYEKPYMSF